MPPKKPPKPPRCAYIEGGQRCKRAATTGNPPVCEAHRIVLEHVADTPIRPGERIASLLGRAIRGQKISDDQIFGGIEDLVGVFQSPTFEQVRAQAAERVRQFRQQANGQQQRRQVPRPRQDDAITRAERARIVLGFAAGQKVTAEEVKKKHRELARKHHPDRGGSVAKMQEVNRAVDDLMATL